MDVIFETQSGRAFCIEVGFFDTVLEIKEKVQKYQGIPLTNQTLVFNGQVLQDERDVEYCELLQNSHVHLLVPSDSDHKYIQQPQPQTPLPSNANDPSNDPVLLLKDKVQDQTEPVPVNWLVDHSDECQLMENDIVEILNILTPPTSPGKGAVGNIMPPPTGSGKGAAGATTGTGSNWNKLKATENNAVDVNMMPPPTTRSRSRSSGKGASTGSDTLRLTCKDSTKKPPSEKLKLLVLPRHGTKKIAVEMNVTDNVGELRKELEKLQKKVLLPLPPEGYFFIHKQSVMDDDRSFRWHHVRQGDTIQIFNGYVTRGKP